jgi:S1-C subfamily serine protease
MELPMSKISSSFAGRLISALALCAALGFAAPASATFIGDPSIGGNLPTGQSAPTTPVALMQPGDVYRMVRTSITHVVVTYPVKNKTEGGAGTGFLVDDHGDLATNCHVVSAEDATGPVRVEIQFPDDPTWLPAKVLGCDAAGDIAVIHVDGLSPNRRPLHFAKPGTFGPGDEVIAVGYGHSLDGDPSVSRGIISAVHRSFIGFGDLVQTDAVINHGNSGGPLLNMHGEVVGVNSYGEASTLNVADVVQAQKQNALDAGSVPKVGLNVVQGIYYARSATTAQVYVQKIIATGRVARPDLGVDGYSLNATWVHLPRQGVLIKSVKPGSAAERAGLAKGMVIYAIDLGNGVNWQVRSVGDLNDALAFTTPGRAVKLYFFALTDKGIDLANDGKSVPASEAKWYNVDIVPADTAPRRTVVRLLN